MKCIVIVKRSGKVSVYTIQAGIDPSIILFNMLSEYGHHNSKAKIKRVGRFYGEVMISGKSILQISVADLNSGDRWSPSLGV